MKVTATTELALSSGADTIVVGLIAGEGVAHDLPGEPLGALLESGEAGSDPSRVAVVHAEGRRFVLIGLGERERLDAEGARCAAGRALTRAQELRTLRLCWEVPHHVEDAIAAALVEGTLLRDYRFERFKPAVSTDARPRVQELILSAITTISPRWSRGQRRWRPRRTAYVTSASGPPTTSPPARWPDPPLVWLPIGRGFR